MLPAGRLLTIDRFSSLRRLAALTLTVVLTACGNQILPTASPTMENFTAAPTLSVSSATSQPQATITVTPTLTSTGIPAEGALIIPVSGPTNAPAGSENPNTVGPAADQPPATGGESDKFQNFQPTNAFLIPVTGYPSGIVTRQKPDLELHNDSSDLSLVIPSLNINIPIVGISLRDKTWDVSWLWDQAGWLEGTAYPTWKGNSVITAHVVTADGKDGPFAQLKVLGMGEYIFVNTSGYRHIYQVISKDSVKPDDTSVFSHEDDSRLTLITCDSYDEATKTYLLRTVVRAKLVDVRQ